MPPLRVQDSEVRGQENKGFSIRCQAGRAEILLYDVIDSWYGVSAKQIHDELKAAGEVSAIDLRINSPGGSITEGMAVYSILKRHPARVIAYIDGLAASMASVVAMAADEIVMTDGAYIMIHNPLGAVVGDSQEMREYADLLDKMKSQLVNIYAAKTKQSAEAVAALMDAGETWFTAAEAIAAGFADRSTAQLALAASFDPSRFSYVPPQLKLKPTSLSGEAQMSETLPATETAAAAASTTPPPLPQPASYADLKAECLGADAPFLCAQLDAKATAAQARQAWMTEQQTRLAAAQDEIKTAKTAAAARAIGVAPLGNGSGKSPAAAGGDPIAEFNEAIAAKTAAGMTRQKAVLAVAAENPDLHEAFVDAHNAARR
jgi:ATP-dependent Clp endopeptidase proteolytic subunit ClpP